MQKYRKHTLKLAQNHGLLITIRNGNIMKIDESLSNYLKNRNEINPIDKMTWVTANFAAKKADLTKYVVMSNTEGDNPVIRRKELDEPKGRTKYLVSMEDVNLFKYVQFEAWEQLIKLGVVKENVDPLTKSKYWERIYLGTGGEALDTFRVKTPQLKKLVDELYKILS